MASVDLRSRAPRSRRTRWQRACNVTLWLTLSSSTVIACSSGPIGGGTGGGGNACIDAGDACTPGVPIPRDEQCVVGFDCCVNVCTCGTDGKVRCEVTCDGNGSGGACGGDGGPGTRCDSDSVCGSGLKCCYPCGIAGCENQCMAPMPDGRCPLFP